MFMSEQEKKMLEANRNLVNQKNEMFKDIILLIRYIQGHKELKEQVKEVITYYKKFNKYKTNKLERTFKYK